MQSARVIPGDGMSIAGELPIGKENDPNGVASISDQIRELGYE
jgi:hypothetical protein